MSWMFQLRAILVADGVAEAEALVAPLEAAARPLGPPANRILEVFEEAPGRFDFVINWDLEGDQGPAFEAFLAAMGGRWQVRRQAGEDWHTATGTLLPGEDAPQGVEYAGLTFQSPLEVEGD